LRRNKSGRIRFRVRINRALLGKEKEKALQNLGLETSEDEEVTEGS
jgi:hypothetical protein